MQKPKEHIYKQYAYTAKHDNIEVSYMQFVWCIITVSWKFRLIHWFCYLKCIISDVWCQCSVQMSSLVWLYKQHHMQYLLHWTPATVHRLTPWISWPRCRDGPECTCFLPGENLCHFLHSNVVYSCSFLAVVNFSDLLLLQNTHTQPLS